MRGSIEHPFKEVENATYKCIKVKIVVARYNSLHY